MMPHLVLRPLPVALTAASLALTTLPSAAKPQSTAAATIDRFMTRAAEYGQFDGAILVVDGGHIVHERTRCRMARGAVSCASRAACRGSRR